MQTHQQALRTVSLSEAEKEFSEVKYLSENS